jgi:integrase
MVKAVSVNRKTAEEYAAKLITERAEGTFFNKYKPLSFERSVEIFLGDCQDRVAEGRMAEYTAEMYEGRIKAQLLPAFRGMEIGRLEQETIIEYKRRRMGEGAKGATINLELAILKRIFSILIKKGMLKSSPAQGVELIRANKRDRYLTEAEISALLEQCRKPKLRMLVMIALNTGLRLDGCISLKWSEIDFRRNQITKIVKGGKTVYIPLTVQLRDALLAYRGNLLNLDGYVVTAARGGESPLHRKTQFGFREACERAGIKDFHFHDIRHTFSTHFLARTKDIYTLSHILGHSAVTMTERYAHLLDDTRREAMAQFGGFC